MALVVEHHVEHLVVLAVHRLAIQRLDSHILTIGVLVAGFGKISLFRGEVLDDFFRVTSLGGVFSSAPSWASTNGDANPQASNARQRAIRPGNFIPLVYRILRIGAETQPATPWREPKDSKLRPLEVTAVSPPSNPSPLSEVGG